MHRRGSSLSSRLVTPGRAPDVRSVRVIPTWLHLIAGHSWESHSQYSQVWVITLPSNLYANFRNSACAHEF